MILLRKIIRIYNEVENENSEKRKVTNGRVGVMEFTNERRDKLIETALHMITRKPTSPESEYLRDLAQIALNVLIAEEAGTEARETYTDQLLADMEAENSRQVLEVMRLSLRNAELAEALQKAQCTAETQASERSHLEYRIKNIQDAHRYWAERASKNESAAGMLFLAKRRISELEALLNKESILPVATTLSEEKESMTTHRMYQFPLQLTRIAALIESISLDEPSLMMRDIRAGLVELLAHRRAEIAGPLTLPRPKSDLGYEYLSVESVKTAAAAAGISVTVKGENNADTRLTAERIRELINSISLNERSLTLSHTRHALVELLEDCREDGVSKILALPRPFAIFSYKDGKDKLHLTVESIKSAAAAVGVKVAVAEVAKDTK